VYVNYHRGDFLTKALLDNHFEVIDTKRFRAPDKNGEMITDLVLTGRKITG
jgi:hypothetical protein